MKMSIVLVSLVGIAQNSAKVTAVNLFLQVVGPNDRVKTILLFSHNAPRISRCLWDDPDHKIAWRDCSFHVADVGTVPEALPVSRTDPDDVQPRITSSLSQTVTGGAQARN